MARPAPHSRAGPAGSPPGGGVSAPAAVRVPGRVPVRVGPVSGVWRPRVVAVPAVALGLLVLVSALSIGRGDVAIPVGDVLAVLVGGGARAQQFVVLELRLPR